MKVEAKFSVYGQHVEELREVAFERAENFFRVTAAEIKMTEMVARPVVTDSDGAPTRWRAHVTMEADDDDE